MKIKTYTVIFTCDENGGLHCERQNEGFNAFEILGMLENVQIQLVEMMHGRVKIPIENTKISSVQKDRITIDYVINKCNISQRLKWALRSYIDYFEVVYLDEIDTDLMRKKIRNFGRLSENQLIELKEELLNK